MGENVSLIDGHIDEERKQKNYERIRNMSVEELAEFICGIYDYFDEDKIKQWLEQEVSE